MQTKKSLVATLAIVFIAAACGFKINPQQAFTKQTPSETACKEGQLYEALSLKPVVLEEGMIPGIKLADLRAVGGEYQIVFDTCMDLESLDISVARIRMAPAFFPKGLLVEPKQLSGFDAYFTEGDTSQISGTVLIPTSPSSQTFKGLKISGGTYKDQKLVWVQRVRGPADNLEASTPVLVGTLDHGDAMASDPCLQKGLGPAQKSWVTFAETRIDFTTCPMMGTSGTFAFDIVGLTIEDKNSKLLPELQQPMTLSGAALQEKLTYKISHHNENDTFLLDLPHGTYRIESFGSMSSGLMWQFKIEYKNNLAEAVEGQLNCQRHYIGCQH